MPNHRSRLTGGAHGLTGPRSIRAISLHQPSRPPTQPKPGRPPRNDLHLRGHLEPLEVQPVHLQPLSETHTMQPAKRRWLKPGHVEIDGITYRSTYQPPLKRRAAFLAARILAIISTTVAIAILVIVGVQLVQAFG